MAGPQEHPSSTYQYKTIGEFTYRCRKLPAIKALQLGTETARYLGSAIATILAGASSEKTDWWALGLFILQDGLTNLTPEATENLMLRLMDAVYVDEKSESLGTEKAFNAHFNQAGLLAAMDVWRWALEVNFKSFFDDLRSRSSQSGSGQAEPLPQSV
jgi:hypothetical protein